MTKAQVVEQAKEIGTKFAADLTEEHVRFDLDVLRDGASLTLRQFIATEAVRHATLAGLKAGSANCEAFCDAFVKAATQEKARRWYELPDVKAAMREDAFRRAVARILEESAATLERFSKRFAEDPADAFSWGTQAVQAAANQKWARAARALLDAGKTRDEVQAAILQQAKYKVRLEHSTSPMSNLMEQAEAIACLTLGGFTGGLW